MKPLAGFLSELRQLDVQLWLEGDRLRYRAPEGTLSPELLAELKARKADILSFLQTATRATQVQRPSLVAIERSQPAPLSFAQQRFWLLHQFEPDSSANNMPVVLRLTGQLDLAALEASLTELVRRHEILRTTFPLVNGEPRQVVAPASGMTVPVVDLRALPADQRDAAALRLATDLARQPFNLLTGPMLYVKLFRLTEQDYLFIWSLHCITGDGSSSDIFYQELTTLYAAFAAGRPSPLAPLPIQYADFAQWQRQWLQGEVLEQQLAYWKQQLGGNLAAIQLPTDHPRPPQQTFRGDRCPRMFSKQLHSDLLKLSQQTGTTLFMILLAAFKTLLYRYSGQEDLLISFTNAGRNQMETESLIGFFSGTLLLRTDFTGNPSFRNLLQRVREEALEAYAHQDIPFEKLVEELRPEQHQSRSPLFQIKFALNPPWTQGRGMSSVHLPDLAIDALFGYIYHGTTKFDLILVMREQEQGLGAVFDYNADLFDAATAERMMDHFHRLLTGIVANPDQPILELPLLTSAERQQQLVAWNQTQAAAEQQTSIPAAFAIQVQQTPEAIALQWANQRLTYRQLDEQTNRVARYLHTLEIRPGERIGVCLERSPQAIIAMLGILKAGGSYVPLDPAEPELQSSILEAAQVRIVLTQQQETRTQSSRSQPVQLVWLDTEPAIQQASSAPVSNASTADCPAYTLYSSAGATGLSISHAGVLNLVQTLIQTPAQTPAQALAQNSPTGGSRTFLHHTHLTQAAAAFEIWACLLTGSRLVIAPPAPILDATPPDATPPNAIGQIIQQDQITDLWLPPRWLHHLVVHGLPQLRSLRRLVTGGDLLSVAHTQTLLQTLPDCQLTQVYLAPSHPGFACYNPLTRLDAIDSTIPIGRPIAHTQVYLLNDQHQPVPIGVPGELYLGGGGIAADDAANLDCLIPNPFSSVAQWLYRTGDLARYLPDGRLELLGQRDQLITIRDWRIELGRIEALLGQHPAVQETVIVAHPDLPTAASVVAYLMFHPGQSASGAELRNYLRQKLPILMVPSYFISLAAIPLTATGRVDLERLPFPTQQTQLTPAAPKLDNQLEQRLIKIWQALFNLPEIDRQDNFFDLGGNSLLAVRLFAQIEQEFGKKLPLSVLLQSPTVQQLAALLTQADVGEVWSPLVLIQPGSPTKLPLFCIHGMGFNVLIYRHLAANLDPTQPVYGLQARGLDGTKDRISDHLEAIAADYICQIQTVQPQGPYFLAGLSNGGNIALEMAQQLLAQGEQVALVALFDTFGPDSIKLLPPLPRFLSSLQYFARFSLPQLGGKVLHNPKALLTELQRIPSWRRHQAQPLDDDATERLRQLQRNREPIARSTPKSSVLERWMERISQSILDRSSWSFLPQHLLKDVDGTIASAIQELEQTYSKVQAAYCPSAYPGKLVLFRANESPPGYQLDPLLGWGEIAQEGVEVFVIPGNHTSILQSQLLATKLAPYLDCAYCEKVELHPKRSITATALGQPSLSPSQY